MSKQVIDRKGPRFHTKRMEIEELERRLEELKAELMQFCDHYGSYYQTPRVMNSTCIVPKRRMCMHCGLVEAARGEDAETSDSGFQLLVDRRAECIVTINADDFGEQCCHLPQPSKR